MKMFNEESNTPKEFILILDKKEMIDLIQMAETACEQNNRKQRWKRILSTLQEKAACY